MNAHERRVRSGERSVGRRAASAASQRPSSLGFTLVELLVSITILGIIVAPLSIAFVTGLRFLGRSDQRFNDSRSALISASYFAGDVSGANVVVKNDTAACGGGTALVSFDSSNASDGVGGAVNSEVSYVVNTSDAKNTTLLRKACLAGGAATTSTASLQLGSTPVVTCYSAANVVDTSCAAPFWVKMVVTQKANTASPDNPAPTPYVFTLVGTVRSR